MSSQNDLTDDWLREAGFKWSQIERQPSRHWILWLGGCVNRGPDGKRQAMTDSRDLGIEVASGAMDGEWFCWLRSDAAHLYHRFIHLRHIRTTDELVKMIEGITGQAWDVANNWDGCMMHPVHAALARAEADRLDRKMLKDAPKWSEAERDNTRAGALPENLTAAIKNGDAF